MARKTRKMSVVLFERYEYLANKYAGKIFSYEQLSFEYEDLVQEFKIKIFTSIKSYGRRWGKFRRGEASRPVPLKYYLEAACSNKMKDFTKYISRENYKTRIDEIDYDYGVEDDTAINPGENKFQLNGIDLLEGLTGKEKIVFSLFLRGYNARLLSKVYYSNDEEKRKLKDVKASGDDPITVTDIIELQKRYLIETYGNELLQQKRTYSTYSCED